MAGENVKEHESSQWFKAWMDWVQRAKEDGFFLIHLEPGEMAIAYEPRTASTSSRIVASRPKKKSEPN